jgi:hypothetical protein
VTAVEYLFGRRVKITLHRAGTGVKKPVQAVESGNRSAARDRPGEQLQRASQGRRRARSAEWNRR